MKLEAKFKLLLGNFELLPNNSNSEAERKHCIKLKLKDHEFKRVNSCNGLLCLSEPSFNEPVTVCNPITGELVQLPEATRAEGHRVSKNQIASVSKNQIASVSKNQIAREPQPCPAAISNSLLGRVSENMQTPWQCIPSINMSNPNAPFPLLQISAISNNIGPLLQISAILNNIGLRMCGWHAVSPLPPIPREVHNSKLCQDLCRLPVVQPQTSYKIQYYEQIQIAISQYDCGLSLAHASRGFPQADPW